MDGSAGSVSSQLTQYVNDPVGTFTPFTGGQLTAYQYIQQTFDPRDLKNVPFPPLDPSKVSNMTKPDDIVQDDWDAVVHELVQEMRYAIEIDAYFNKVHDFFTDAFVLNSDYLQNTILTEVKDTNDSDDPVASFIMTNLVSGSCAAIGAVPVPGAGIVSGTLGAIAGYVQNSSTMSSNDITSAVSAAGAALRKSFQDCLGAQQTMEKTILQNPASLLAMGAAMETETSPLSWPEDTGAMTTAATAAFSIQMWQVVLPLFWDLVDSQDNPAFLNDYAQSDADSYVAANPNYYVTFVAADGGYNVTYRWLGRGTMTLNAKSPSDALCTEIFTNLSVPRADVFNQQNGWTGFTEITFMKDGGCAAGGMTAFAVSTGGGTVTDVNAQLAALRQFRQDLLPSAMGAWYVGAYYAVSTPIVDLYNNDPTVKEAIRQYGGVQLWSTVLGVISTGSLSPDVDVATAVQNALAILSVVQTAADNASDTAVSYALDQLTDRLADYLNVRSRADLIAAIAQETPPSATFQPPAQGGNA
jgi:hypothetical protein